MSPEEFISRRYDYVIVGGGRYRTAGLTIAARLTEDESVTVGVIEAGKNQMGNPIIDTPVAYLQALGDPDLDWKWRTEPQQHSNGRIHEWPRGKCLGGSSAFNFHMWAQASRSDLDNLAKLGNPGWGFDDLLPYYQKCETYNPPSKNSMWPAELSSYIDETLRGTSGPIQTSFPETDLVWTQKAFPEAYPRTGTAMGGFNPPATVDPKTATRSYAASAYYAPNASRSNLHVLTEAHAARIVFQSRKDELVATGVEFLAGSEGRQCVVNCDREVIICGGAINTPQILELSGIGSAAILDGKVPCLIDNPGVGENLMDHPLVLHGYELEDGVPSFDDFRNPDVRRAVMDTYTQHKAGPLTNPFATAAYVSHTTVESDERAEQVNRRLKKLLEDHPGDTVAARETISLAAKQLFDSDEADGRIVCAPTGCDTSDPTMPSRTFTHSHPGRYGGLAIDLTRVFSRGFVHIRSADPLRPPIIDPRYLSHPLDLEILALTIIESMRVHEMEPMASRFKRDSNGDTIPMPGQRAIKTVDDARKHVRETCVTEYHPIGTCAMLPREKGGVIDSSLKVYGTKNVRVCDASIFPMHVQGNISSLVYATAEKGADIIRYARERSQH
ncbi:alcohol oxidase [Rhizodiscina lignyota]|uniref:Alcohol oxidase n=1 Tax=Rhizodiscina lignyota TaxID=1504668 RepID=A0A9P4I516_9PEZI|nr:alcohol oxidase [Rhizodiscina lignyota]